MTDQITAFDFEAIYLKYKNMVWHQVNNSTVMGEGLKEEIVQDIFVKLYKTIGNFQSEKAIKRWLNIVTKSTIIDSGRKSSTYKKYIDITFDDDNFEEYIDVLENLPLDNIMKNEMAEVVKLELKKLKPIYHEVIVLYYYLEFSVKEIAKRLNIPENTVYSRLKKARSILYKTIGDAMNKYLSNGDEKDGYK